MGQGPQPAETIHAHASLREALSVMNARGQDALAVVEKSPRGERFSGLLTRDGLLQAYERALKRAV